MTSSEDFTPQSTVLEQRVDRLEIMQSEIRGLQTENRRILDHLLGQQDS